MQANTSISQDYVKMCHMICRVLDINLTDYMKGYQSVYDRMSAKLGMVKPHITVTQLIFAELMDSAVDILYYVADYHYTCIANGLPHNPKVCSEELEESSYSKVAEFSFKACQDYEESHTAEISGEIRTVDDEHIVKMIVDEMFEGLANLVLYYRIEDFDSDVLIKCLVEYKHYGYDSITTYTPFGHDDVDSLSVYDCVMDFLGNPARELLAEAERMFTVIHEQNMAKAFDDGKFHFQGMKVIKPEDWQEIDSPMTYEVSRFDMSLDSYLYSCIALDQNRYRSSGVVFGFSLADVDMMDFCQSLGTVGSMSNGHDSSDIKFLEMLKELSSENSSDDDSVGSDADTSVQS